MPQKSVYLAGPEVFLANAREILDIKIALTRAAGLIPVERGPDGIMIETMGFADNLMLHGGVLNRGGVVVVGDAAGDGLYTDMEAFKSVLALAAIKLR